MFKATPWVLGPAFLLLGACGESTTAPDERTSRTPDAARVSDSGAPKKDAAFAAPDASTIPSGDWQSLAPLPELPRYYVGVAGVRNQVFVIGGLSEGPEASAVHAYDVARDSWQRLADLPEPVPMANVAAVDDRLFVLGAMNVRRTFEYDFDNDAWLTRTPLPVTNGPGAAAVGVSGRYVYLAGGVLPGLSANMLNTGVRVEGAYVYDTVQNIWDTLPSLPIAVGYSMGAVLNGEWWVMGGSDNMERTDRVYAFDMEQRSWASKPALPVTLSSAAAAVLEGRLYLAGGIASTSGVITPLSYVFNESTQGWQHVAPMNTPRFGMAAGVVDNKMYLPTGIKGESPTEFVPVGDLEVFTPGE